MKFKSLIISVGILVSILFTAQLKAENLPSILDLSGEDFASNKTIHFNQFKGQYIYLDFWASWCAPCIESLPFMEKMHQSFHAQGLKIIAVNIDKEKRDAIQFLIEHPISYLNLYDPAGKLGKQLNVSTMPTAFLIAPDGNILLRHSGFDKVYAKKLRDIIETKLQLVK